MGEKQETKLKADFWVERVLPVTVVATLLAASSVSKAQKEPSDLPLDSFLLRIENAKFGRVEASLDGGESYLLLGRVIHPAANASGEKAAKTVGDVVKSGGGSLAFAVAPGQALKILYSPSGRNGTQVGSRSLTVFSASEIVADLPTESGTINDFLPQAKSKTLLQSGSRGAFKFPSGYSVTLGDKFIFTVPIPSSKSEPTLSAPDYALLRKRKDDFDARILALNKAYDLGALGRAKREKRRIVSGRLKFLPKLPEDEPEPIVAVSYSIDGDVIALHNSLPSVFNWDTQNILNGEHVIEVKGLSKYDTTVTSIRIMIVVNN